MNQSSDSEEDAVLEDTKKKDEKSNTNNTENSKILN
jgi:hypothetical protein